MKINRIALTILAGASLMLSACQNEEEFNGVPVGKNEIAFKIGGVDTKAAIEKVQLGNTVIEFGEDDSNVFLEESITSLDDNSISPITRGTPAFTENVTTLYDNVFYALANPGISGKELPDGVFGFDEDTECWKRRYGENVWAKAPLNFYMRMPQNPAGVQGAPTYSDGTITFNYKTPETASDQQDILFTSTTLNSEEDNHKTVVFYHALTGVKFANYFDNASGTQTIIKSVKIKGLTTEGKCVMTPANANNTTPANAKPSAKVSKWTPDDNKTADFEQTFNEAFADYSKSAHDLSKLNGNAAKKNLNDNNGSLTFWFIPQTLSGVTLDIEFEIKVNGTVVNKKTYEDIPFAEGATWSAGELHTFTLKPTLVDVVFEDDVDETIKDNVTIQNTGNVNMYVRASITGGWADDEDMFVIGYVNDDPYDNETVAPWVLGDTRTGITVAVPNGYGTFTNLALPSRHWVVNGDYFYYTEVIGPGQYLPETEPLFDQYKVGTKPQAYMPKRDNILERELITNKLHMVMDIAVQAIEADKFADYKEAWNTAAGVTFE